MDLNNMTTISPPVPPPLPSNIKDQPAKSYQSLRLRTTTSSNINKLQNMMQQLRSRAFDDNDATPICTGWYFVYGTLMDPSLVKDILSLDSKPNMHNARVIGYEMRLWGQYPALTKGRGDQIVIGKAFEVQLDSHARRLHRYETNAYTLNACTIELGDLPSTNRVQGFLFSYAGNPSELREGEFDLDVWLRGMGRGSH